MNFALTTTAATQATTMSSREIAELCDKRHDHVMRDIEKMLSDIGEDGPKFGGMYRDAYGREKPCFNLPKDLTFTLITGYRADLRYKVIKRLEELEVQVKSQAPAVPNFMDPVQAAEAWIAAYKAQQIAQEKVQELQPLAIVGARAASHDHSLNRFMRTLPGVNTMKIKSDLKAHNYLYKREGTYRVYSRYLHLFMERSDDTTGNVDIFPTAAGRAALIEMYEAGRLTMKKGCVPHLIN